MQGAQEGGLVGQGFAHELQPQEEMEERRASSYRSSRHDGKGASTGGAAFPAAPEWQMASVRA